MFGGSGELFSMPAWGPEPDTSNPDKKSDVVAYTCNPSLGKVDTGGWISGSWWPPSLAYSGKFQASERFCPKKQGKSSWDWHLKFSSVLQIHYYIGAPMHDHIGTPMHGHIGTINAWSYKCTNAWSYRGTFTCTFMHPPPNTQICTHKHTFEQKKHGDASNLL